MSTNSVLVPTSLVSQFLETEKIASRQWLQCQIELLLDHVFGQLGTKFEDYVASRGITGTENDYQMDPDGIEYQQEHRFPVHSHLQFPATGDHLINTELPVAVGQSQNQPSLSFSTSNIEQLNQNNDEYDLVGGHQSNGQLNNNIGDDTSEVDSDLLEIKEEIDDTNNELITSNQQLDPSFVTARMDTDQVEVMEEIDDSNDELFATEQSQNPPSTSKLEQSNQKDNDQLPNDDIDYDALRMDSDKPEVKEEFDETNNEIIIADESSQVSLPTFASTSNEQSSHNLTSENDDEFSLDGTRDDDQQNGLGHGDIDDNAQTDTDEVEVKEEFDDSNKELFTINQPQNQHASFPATSNLEQSYKIDGLDGGDNQPPNEQLDELDNELMSNEQNSQTILSKFASTTNEQSNYNLTKRRCDDEDDSGNGIEANQEDGDTDNVEVTEYNEEPSRPRKKPKLNPTQPNNRQSLGTRQSSRLANLKQTEQVESNNQQTSLIGRQPSEEETNEMNQEKQIVTLSVQCNQTGCSLMFINKSQLELHMRFQHQILSYQCIIKDCKQSFRNKQTLTEHITNVHPNTTEWLCDKCSKHFPTYRKLYNHYLDYHQLGIFKCAFANCAFTGGHKRKVYDHYKYQHKTEFICQHPNCGSRFKQKSDLNKHQRVHLGIKPYRCKWSGCDFACARRSDTLAHIKRMHLKPDQSSNEQPLIDPKQYLEVLSELL